MPTASSLFQPVKDSATALREVTCPEESVVMTASPMEARVTRSHSFCSSKASASRKLIDCWWSVSGNCRHADTLRSIERNMPRNHSRFSADCKRIVINPFSLERLEQRLESRLNGFVVRRHGRDLAVDAEQLVDGRLGDPHRVLHREDDIIRDLDELPDEREIF